MWLFWQKRGALSGVESALCRESAGEGVAIDGLSGATEWSAALFIFFWASVTWCCAVLWGVLTQYRWRLGY